MIHSRDDGLPADRRAGAAAPHRERVRRSGDPPACDGVGRSSALPGTLWPKLAALGLTGIQFPEEYGGSAMSAVDYCICIEELARVCPGVALSVAAHNGLCLGAHRDVRERRRRSAASCRGWPQGEVLGAWGLTEAGAGSDAAGMRTTAVRNGGELGHQRIEELHHARTHRRRDGGHGGHRSHQGAPRHLGVRRRTRHAGHDAPARRRTSSGCARATRARSCSRTAACRRRSCSATKGRASSTRCRCSTRVASASRRSRSDSRRAPTRRRVDYAKERRQFGQPIAAFQAIQWKLADNATRIEAARLLTYRAAYLKDRGVRTTRESSMAKLYASEIAVKAADDCVQIHGGYGFVKDYPAEKYFRDVKLLTIGEGTSEIQRLVIARQLLGQ